MTTGNDIQDAGPTTKCHVCGTVIPARNGKGRPRKYCSEKCRSQDNRNRARAWRENQRDNELKIAKMRKTIEDDEQVAMFQLDEITGLRDENRRLKRLLKQDANDLAALLDGGVLVMRNSERTAPLLARHMGVWRNMEEWEDREDDPIENQEKRVLAMQRRHREELDKVQREGRNTLYLEGVLRQQHEESRKVNRECSAYWAWRAATEYEQDMADQYGLRPASPHHG